MTREPRILGRWSLYTRWSSGITIGIFIASQSWITSTDCSCWGSASPTWTSYSSMRSSCASRWDAVGRRGDGSAVGWLSGRNRERMASWWCSWGTRMWRRSETSPGSPPRCSETWWSDTHAETTEERRMVQRLAGGWTDGGHHIQASGHGGVLQAVDVPVLCAAQYHLPFSPGRLSGRSGRVRRSILEVTCDKRVTLII